jgi:8-oxo-dGTP pyrophosphatase MutT (NUDIX family)
MGETLDAFLTGLIPVHESESIWGGATRLRLRWYLTANHPPGEFVTSIRCIVLSGDSMLVMRNRDGQHIWPGGRREAGETPQQTIARELMEEAGCVPGEVTPIGFVHLRRLTPVPADHPFPAPDFCWLVYATEATSLDPAHTVQDDYEEGADLVPLKDVPALRLEPPAEQFLQAALAALGRRS